MDIASRMKWTGCWAKKILWTPKTVRQRRWLEFGSQIHPLAPVWNVKSPSYRMQSYRLICLAFTWATDRVEMKKHDFPINWLCSWTTWDWQWKWWSIHSFVAEKSRRQFTLAYKCINSLAAKRGWKAFPWCFVSNHIITVDCSHGSLFRL